MKKLLLIPFMLLGICQLEAQIIITGVMYDPKGPDAPAQGSTYTAPSTTEPAKDSEGNIYIYKGGYEYVQFMATENIDFSTTNYSVVVCRQPGGTTPSVDNGWASGGNRTFKFNLTSGTVTKGSYFYVGGPEKRLGGFTYETNSGVTTAYPTLDISASNWIRTIAYSGVSGTDAGDGFGASTTALIANSGNPSGVAVFAGTSVTEASVPLDAIFITSANPASSGSIGTVYVPENGSIPAKGYRVPNNDRYSQTNGADAQPFFGMGTNTYGFVYQQYTPFSLPTDQANFLMLGGKYNETTQTWDTPRAASYVTLVPTADEAGANFGTLDMTEGTGATTLPVSLVSFTAKNQTSGVVLNWVTASEQNNKQFTLLRSMDGKQFTAIGSVFGNGTTQNTSNYNFIDANPVSGVNYYKLLQVDNDGKTKESAVISATTDLEKTHIGAYATTESTNLNIFAVNAGKATVTLTDMSGREVVSLGVDISKGYNNLPIAVSLTTGVYVVSLQTSSELVRSKFVVR